MRPKSIQEVYDRMDSLTEVVLKTKHIQGFCYTQLTDVEQETNGVYLYDRKTKFNMNKINFGLVLLILIIIMLSLFYTKISRNFTIMSEQLEIIDSKLDHIEYDLHELEEK